MSTMLSAISSIALGPLQDARPSVGVGWLTIGIGFFGLIYISVNLLAGKGKDVSKLKIGLGLAVFLFFIVNGTMQILTAR
jgi:hypothetical protein